MNFGKILILRRLHLPNQEWKPVCHLSNKVRVFVNRGGKFRSNVRVVSGGMYVPKYLSAVEVHLKLKFDWSSARVVGGTETPIASDFEKFIFK